MKLKTRIIVGFGMSILVPLLLFSATLYGLGHTKFAQQTKDSSEVVYDISVGESTHSQTQVRIIAKDLLFTATVILVFTALSIGLWIYRSIATPLVKLKKATQNIKEGNLDFVLEVDGDDEFSELCRDFEEMRKRLKESAEEKVLMDKENKELISNISHDLKTLPDSDPAPHPFPLFHIGTIHPLPELPAAQKFLTCAAVYFLNHWMFFVVLCYFFPACRSVPSASPE